MRSLVTSAGRSPGWRRGILWASVPVLLALMGAVALRSPSAPETPAAGSGIASLPRVESPLTRRILLIVLDAWRRQTAFDDPHMTYLADLARHGSRGPMLSGVRTLTKACVRELLTGQRSSLSDSTHNLVAHAFSGQSLLTRMDEAHMKFTMVDAFEAFGGLYSNRFPPASVRKPSVAGLPYDSLDPAHDGVAEAVGLEVLRDPAQRLVLIHLESVDLAGHIHSPHTDAYDRVVMATDERIRRLAAPLDLARDTLVVVGDHGSDDQGHHGGPNREARETAYLAVGGGIHPGSVSLDPLDLAATLSTLLGLCPPEQSIGSPEEGLLAGDPRALKARCDECLRDRLAAAGTAGADSDQARAYFAAPAYTSSTAVLYKALVRAGGQERRSPLFLPVAVVSILVGLWLLHDCEAPQGRIAAWAVPVALLVMAVSTERDLIAIVLYAAALLVLASRELNGWRALAVATTLLMLVGTKVALPSGNASPLARIVGLGILVSAAVALAPRVLRRTRIGRLGFVALTAILAAVAATLVRSDQIPGHFSWELTLIDYALATGVLFLVVGVVVRERALVGLAAMALAACFFHGLPLGIFALLTILPSLGERPLRPPVFLPVAFLAPLGALALLRAQNGGYGFSRIDLSLVSLGIPWVGKPNYVWSAAVILLSYLVPLSLAAWLGQRIRGIARMSLGAIVAAFLVFGGVDLLFLTLPGVSLIRIARLEEVFVFDVVFGFLALLLFASTFALQRIGGTAIVRRPRGDRRERSVVPQTASRGTEPI